MAIKLDDNESSEAHRYLGAVYIELGQPERAAGELETYLRLAPNAKDVSRIRQIIKDQRSNIASSK